VLGIARDITERKKAEEQVERIFNMTGYMVCVAGLDGYFKRVNASFEEVLGYSAEELLARPFNDFVHPEDRAKTAAVVEEKLAEGEQVIGFENRYRCKDGSYKWLSWTSRPVVQEGIMYAIAYDITERKQAQQSLEESESRFRELVENIREVFWMENVEGTELLYVSPAYEEIWGRSCEEFYRNPKVWIDAIHPDDRQRVYDHFSQFRETGKYSEEFRIVRPDGMIRWIWDRGVLIHNESGEVTRVAGIAEDITERKEVEDALKESEKRFRILSEAAFEGIGVAEKGVLVDANKAFTRIIGYSLEELKGKQVIELVAPEHRELVTENIRSGYEGIYEHKGLHKDGSLIDLEVHGCSVTYQGRTMRLTAIRDITERKQAEEALRDSEMRSRALLDSSPVCNKIIDLEFRLQFMSAAGQKQLGIADIKPFYGQPYPFDFYPESIRTLTTEYLERAKTGEIVSLELPVHDIEGREVWYYTTFVPVRDEEGRIEYIIATSIDITERKNAEEEARQHQAELAQVRRIHTLGEMASGLAHELNQPLCAILNYANACLLMMKQDVDESGKITDAIRQISAQADRAGEIIRRLRGLIGKREPRQSSCHINEIVGEVLKIEKSEANQRNITVEKEFGENIPLIIADNIQIEQVILNLVRNAFEAMADTIVGQRKLTIQTSTVGSDAVEVIVRDTGRGLSPEDIEEVFDSFFSTKRDGLGVGLSLSRSIIEAHGGHLWAEPNPDYGATFRFTLPLKGKRYE
jgi:PAS domain S-box-containing protein